MLLAFTFLGILGLSWGVCPPAELIAPLCTCRDFHDSMMTCSNVFNGDDLLDPLQALMGRKYKIFSFEINNSSLLYIPHNLFKGAHIEKIRFLKSEIMALSDIDIAFEGLEDTLTELRATNAHYGAQWDWQQLRNLRQLKLLDLNFIVLGSITQAFPNLKNLNALGITNAEIQDIVDYAFADLPALRIFNMMKNQISEVKRSMLPMPALELTFIDLSYNQLEEIPKDFFTSMPSLIHVSLGYNKLIVIPEDTFKVPLQHLEALLYDGKNI
ncbi:uncharacterized protein TNIN_475501 [Trichonephila inaurata madagascariensis]|uniref:Uncharacterized protein n=1 Tax=Trichonephila inaurata madagascariensis TaxID=2747483 RepID=A0A8X6IJY2_9ARAC|nr:uncharacterized protein TNIN_475501 [Trichonephila inaurata madagascariensis]